MRGALALACACALSTYAAGAAATYSIVAVDPEHGQVGAAGASCVPYEVIRILGVVPGRGAFVAQANFDDAAFDEAHAMLAAGAGAAEVLAAVTDADRFPQAPKMQYGVVDALGGLATRTGSQALPVAAGIELVYQGDAFAVLGNVLTSTAVLDQGAEGFTSPGCDLAARLFAALAHAGAGGEGDSRCTDEGRPANSAFLEVADATGTLVRISIPDVSPDDPTAQLGADLDAWRAEHPCPEEPRATPTPAKPFEPRDPGGCSAGGAPAASGPGAALVAAALAARAARRRRSAGAEGRARR